MPHANRTSPTRRIWYGHGSSRIVADDARTLPSTEVIDEAMAGFEPIDAAATPMPSIHAATNRQPHINSLAANLSIQLTALDRQRDRLARLLRDINNIPVAK